MPPTLSEMRDPSIKSLALQSVAVVASILVAFALDAWWGQLAANDALRDELTNVRLELEANRPQFEFRKAQHEKAQAMIAEVLRLFEDADSQMAVSVADTLLVAAFIFVPTSDPSTGALDALISGGQLAQLSGADLKRDLAGLRNAIDDLREGELAARSIAYDRVLPLFEEQAGLEPLLAQLGAPSPGSVSVPIRLPRDKVRAARNYLSLRSGWIRDSERKIESLLSRIEAATEALDLELGTL